MTKERYVGIWTRVLDALQEYTEAVREHALVGSKEAAEQDEITAKLREAQRTLFRELNELADTARPKDPNSYTLEIKRLGKAYQLLEDRVETIENALASLSKLGVTDHD